MSSIRIWLDDLRPMPVGFTHHAHNYDEAIALLTAHPVERMSFDHDLAEEHYSGDFSRAKSGYDVAVWVEERAHRREIARFAWSVHSMNPEGRLRIAAALRSADRAWGDM